MDVNYDYLVNNELVKNPQLLNLFTQPIALIKNDTFVFANTTFQELFEESELSDSIVQVKELFKTCDHNSFLSLNKLLKGVSDKSNLTNIAAKLKISDSDFIESNINLKHIIEEYFLIEFHVLSNISKATSIIQYINHPCCLINYNLEIQEANDAFLEVFNLKSEKQMERNIKSVFSSELITDLNEGIKNVKRDEIKVYDFETEYFDVVLDQTLYYKIEVSRISNTNNYLINLIDQSHEVELLKKIEEAEEKASSLKSNFIAQMSHEIRTPINAILSFANLLKEELKDYITPDLNTGFDVIKRGGERIVRTINLILDISEVMNGTHEYLPNNFDLLSEVVSDVFLQYKNLANERNVECNLTSTVSTHSIFCDQYMVKQIISNIMDNAVKFTAEGSISVNIFNDLDNILCIAFEDTGIGIKDEYITKIFEPFSQEDVGVNRRYEGNGIGLTLAKKYCEMNNIDIHISSDPGKGTKVTLKFNNSSHSSSGTAREKKAINL